MQTPQYLRDEYLGLLTEHGLDVIPDTPTPEWFRTALGQEWVADSIRQGSQAGADFWTETEKLLEPRHIGASMQPLFDNLASHVESRIAISGVELKQPVFVGEFPTGDYNACVVKSRQGRGFIVLLNSGLAFTLWHFAKILTLHMDIAFCGDGDVTLHETDWDRQQTPLAIAKLLFCYMNFVDSRFAPRLPIVGGRRGIILTQMVLEAEKFALAHEYAHVTEDHLGPQYVTRATPCGDLLACAESRDNEYAADLVGIRYLLADLDWSDANKFGIDDVNIRIAGVAVFFAIAAFIDYFKTGSFMPDRPTDAHPPAMDRFFKLLSHLHARYGKEITQMGRVFFSAAIRAGYPMYQEFKALQKAFVDRGRTELPW